MNLSPDVSFAHVSHLVRSSDAMEVLEKPFPLSADLAEDFDNIQALFPRFDALFDAHLLG